MHDVDSVKLSCCILPYAILFVQILNIAYESVRKKGIEQNYCVHNHVGDF